jgi:hypothetical protein
MSQNWAVESMLFRCWVQYRNLRFRIFVWIRLSGGGLNGLLPVEMDPLYIARKG